MVEYEWNNVVKKCHKPSPSHHHKYMWCGYHSLSWVYDIVLPTINLLKPGHEPPIKRAVHQTN